jgi:hypothetical protein
MQQAWNQDLFAKALTDRGGAVPDGVTSWTGPRPLRRFSVYRNNVSGALAEALAIRYPVVQRLVGEKFFSAMARQFAREQQPQSPVLIYYAKEFPEFIAQFAPASSLPYLPDVARLDSAHWESYHEEDAAPVAAKAFAALDQERLPHTSFEFLPSLRIVQSAFPIASIWRTNSEDAEVRPVDLGQAEDALVSRPDMTVEVRTLPPGGAVFLNKLAAGCQLAEAAGHALDAAPSFDLTANLAGLITARLISRIAQ